MYFIEKKICLCYFLMINSYLLNAQSLSLQDCIEIALENNPQLRIAKYQKKVTEKKVFNAYTWIFPNVSLSGSGVFYQQGETYYSGNTRFTVPFPAEKKERYNANISLNQIIFDGGQWWNWIRQAKVNNRSQICLLQDQINATIELVENNYFQLLKEKELLNVYKLAVKRSKEQLERAEKMYELGLVSKIDVARAKVNLGADSIAAINQEISIKSAQHSLNIAMGRDPGMSILIVKDDDLQIHFTSVDSLIKIFYNNNPILQAARYNIKSADINTQLAYGNLYPTISFFMTYSRTVPQMNILYEDFSREYNFSYGVNVRMNLFNGFRNFTNIQLAKINEKSSKELYDILRRDLEASIRQLYNTYIALLKTIEINKDNLLTAEEEYNLAEERYKLGVGAAYEIREAQLSLSTSEQTLVYTQYDARITQINLERQLGLMNNDQ
jgi:outer membrane protein TolC